MVSSSLSFHRRPCARGAAGRRARHLRTLLTAAVLVAASLVTGASQSHAALGASTAPPSDTLYVGDAGDNTVKRFDAQTGQSLGAVVPAGMCSDSKPVGKLCGPRGILRQGTLLVSNQNANLDINGEIDRFNPVNGTSLGAIVPPEAAAAPSAPDGIIISPDGRTLYVADQVGSVERFDRDTGQFLGSLDFSALLPPGAFPRGLVFGPGGVLYISVWSLADQTLGWVLRYNVGTGTVTVVASTATCGELHRPDGLAFGPDGRLYVTSFRKHRLIADDIDRILIVTIGSNGAGRCSDQIDLDQLDNRAFAQYVLFGPGGDLFVPIVTTGEVRRYDVTTKSYTDFVAPGGPLLAGWGLTFGRTNPATLAYGS